MIPSSIAARFTSQPTVHAAKLPTIQRSVYIIRSHKVSMETISLEHDRSRTDIYFAGPKMDDFN